MCRKLWDFGRERESSNMGLMKSGGLYSTREHFEKRTYPTQTPTNRDNTYSLSNTYTFAQIHRFSSSNSRFDLTVSLYHLFSSPSPLLFPLLPAGSKVPPISIPLPFHEQRHLNLTAQRYRVSDMSCFTTLRIAPLRWPDISDRIICSRDR